MKKLIIALLAVLALSSTASAQKFAIGARLGGGTCGYDVAVSGIIGINGDYRSKSQRLQIDLGVTGMSYHEYYFGSHYRYGIAYPNVTGSYQWQFNIVKGLAWSVGPCVRLGFVDYYGGWSGSNYYGYDNQFGLSIGAQGGIEYDFDFPLQLALDIRPMIPLSGFWYRDINDHAHINGRADWFSSAFSVRYCF